MTIDPAPDATASLNSKNKISKKKILSLVIALALTLAGFAAYSWVQKSEEGKKQLSTTEPQEEVVATNPDETKTLSATLPNGKTATYDNIEGNRNITFSSSDMGSEYVALSHKAIGEYISSADKSTINELCGINGELAEKDEIVVGTMSTVERMIQYPTKSNCLDALATMRNPDASSRAKAVGLIALVKADVKQFYSTVIVK